MKTYVDLKLEKHLSSELLNMDKTYEKWLPGNHGKHIYFSRNWNIYNQNNQLKKFEKNLSSAFVDDERP